MEKNLEFRLAREDEAGAILTLYKSMIGTGFCVWDDEYPGEATIRGDMAADCLYVLCENGRIIGTLSVEPEFELDHLDCWRVAGGAREIGRITVSHETRGRGLAKVMVEEICRILRARGVRAIHLSAAKGNIPALRTYEKLDFAVAGEAQLYGGDYYLLEKVL